MSSRRELCFIVSSIFILHSAQEAENYTNFTIKVNAPLFPLDPSGLSGRYTGLWSNYSEREVSKELSYQVWMLSYSAETPKSFFLALVAIRNPSKFWDLTKPVIVWKARQTRLVGEHATLIFTVDGEFKLEEDGDVVWSSNTANRGARSLVISNSATIMLLGENKSNIIWQSSDEPSDIVVLGRALKPGGKLISWNSSQDSSNGLYSLLMEKNRLTLFYDSQPYWSFGNTATEEDLFAVFCSQRTGSVSLDLRSDFSQITPAGLVTLISCSSPGFKNQTMPLPVDGSQLTPFTFIKLKPDGDMVLYSWNSTGRNWVTYLNFSSLRHCFLPNGCGRYRTFVRRDEDCQPPFPLETCKDHLEYRFVRNDGADYFSINYSTPVTEASVGECQARCESNCSCTAAFYSDGSCFLTHAHVQSLQAGKYVALLKVAQPRKFSKKRFQTIALGALVPTLFLLILCLGWHCRRKNDDDEGEEESTLQLSLMPGMPKRFSFQELEEVTRKFSDCLGNGGFGSVSKGILADGTEVAVKKLEGSNQRSKDFFAEVGILARTHHWNLVKLLGFCAQGPRKRLLVYEYMKNGSLERWIFEEDRVHDECAERIIHLDLKPENVLLDDGFQPKIADFGLSKLMDRKEEQLQLTITRGTPGYIAPECIQEGTVTEKTDVFGFGVLLLEIITGSKNRNLSSDYLLGEEKERERLKNVVALCVQDDPNLRPSMSKVIQMMEGVIKLPPAPLESQLNFFLACRPKDQLSRSAALNVTFDKLLDSSPSLGAFSQGGLR